MKILPSDISEGYVVFQRDLYTKRCLAVVTDRKTAEDKRRWFGPSTEIVYGRYIQPTGTIEALGPSLPPLSVL